MLYAPTHLIFSGTDIAGANAAKWASILVRTGVFDSRRGPPKYRPTREAEDIEEAVRWAINVEFRKDGV
jgi:ribonucleotide monophosphatase NagD (HAD superfamily)